MFVVGPVGVVLQVMLKKLRWRVGFDQLTDVAFDMLGAVFGKEILLHHDALCTSAHL